MPQQSEVLWSPQIVRSRFAKEAEVIPDDHRTVHVDDLTPKRVGEEEGWSGIDIRFPLPEQMAKEAGVALFRVVTAPGAKHKVHSHPNADEFFYVIRGRAVLGVGDQQHEISAGTFDFVPRGMVHWMRVDPNDQIESVGGYLKVGSLEEAGYDYKGEIPE
jgi:quercetin dioxygenase-like cupin family protein